MSTRRSKRKGSFSSPKRKVSKPTRGASVAEHSGDEEEVESFRRIIGERKKGKQLQVEWMDGGTSWVDRCHLEGQDALQDWDDREEEGSAKEGRRV